MNSAFDGQFDESRPLTRDFASREVVADYDRTHRRFRDIDGENEAILAWMNLQPDQVLLDMACGTGALARRASLQCRQVVAVDLSGAMLDYAQWRAQEEGRCNIRFCRGGFLTYIHEDPLVDALNTSMALHHLPDFWKQRALNRLVAMLRPGGRFCLQDVVFPAVDAETAIRAWIRRVEERAGTEVADSLRSHVKREYSTYTWIMEGLLVRAGLAIERIDWVDELIPRYLCVKG
ncbi:MAG: class I SAM-dependent methyltransferase [Verrucomicrobiota bacterium]|jgi:ubiquinone/menaquinone biosynthesis C-methylase UbiE|nr:class I SAM-dependent methyltransferase [Verrucomicrobiota bacterium]